jgi:hypothetical protein
MRVVSGTSGVSGHWTYRFGTLPLQERNGSHVTSQTYVGDGVDGNQVVQAVAVRIERRIQRLAECVIDDFRPVCSAQIELHTWEVIASQCFLESTVHMNSKPQPTHHQSPTNWSQFLTNSPESFL